jgi:hypothetical protein
LPPNVKGGREHAKKAEYDSQIAMLFLPMVELLADVSAAVVDIEGDHHEGEYGDYVEYSAVVVPYFEVEEQGYSEDLGEAAGGDFSRIGELYELEEDGDEVADGEAEEPGLQDVVDEAEGVDRLGEV